MEEKKRTGYPSIDKPWMKYYREKPLRELDAEQTLYNFIFIESIPYTDNNKQDLKMLRKLGDELVVSGKL